MYQLTYSYISTLLNSLQNRGMIDCFGGYVYMKEDSIEQNFLYSAEFDEVYEKQLETYFNENKTYYPISEKEDVLTLNTCRIDFHKRLYAHIRHERHYEYFYSGYMIMLTEKGYNSVTDNVLSADDYENKRKEVNTVFMQTLEKTLQNNLLKKYKDFKIGKKAAENRLKREQLQKEYTEIEKRLIMI